MARSRISRLEDRNAVNCKVNDRIHRGLKLLSAVTKTPVSTILTHAIAKYIDTEMEKHEAEIKAFFGGTATTIMAEEPVEVVQAAE
jgi:predicted transcriptional regulator